jgi:serine protease Do
MAKELLPQLKAGKIIRGWLGVIIQDITPELAKSFGLKNTDGVLISDMVKNGPAARAGLKAGDVVLRFDGKSVKDAHALSRMVANTPPDTRVSIDIIRNGKESKEYVTLGTMPTQQGMQPTTEATPLGLTVQDLTPDLAERLGLNSSEKGVVVSQVEPGSPSDEAGIRPGDLIKEVNRKEIDDVDAYNQVVSAGKKGENLLFLIRRGAGSIFVVVKPETKQ